MAKGGCFGPNSFCVRSLRWLPTIFILAVVAWSYYAYVIVLCFETIDSIAQKIVYLILFHIFFIVFIWSYYQIIFTDVWPVPAKFYLPENLVQRYNRSTSEDQQRQLLDDFARDLPVESRTLNGCIRYCDRCQCVKPDRAHHDSVTGRCILKMDHYCPWVNNTVGFNNYKYFVLFLLYSFTYCLYVAVTSLQYFIQFFVTTEGNFSKFHILFVFFVSIMFSIALIGLFGYHIYLTVKNKTTLESFRAPILRTGPHKRAYDLGTKENFQQVFGRDFCRGFLPVHTTLGDGVSYPLRDRPSNSPYSYRSMEQSAHSPNTNNSASAVHPAAAARDTNLDEELRIGMAVPTAAELKTSSEASVSSQVSLLNETRK